MKNWKIFGVRFLDIINPYRWYIYAKGMITKRLLKDMLEPYIIEQYMFRLLQCPQCVLNGKCIGSGDCEGCGCDTWGKMIIPSEKCYCGKWGPMRTKEGWEEIKNNINLKFKVEYDTV